MQCQTKAEAQRIAFFGAKKINAPESGYRVMLISRPNAVGTQAYIANPGGYEYAITRTRSGKETCDCPFYRENEAYGICKHLYAYRWEKEAQEQRRAEEDADADRAEALATANEEYLDAVERYHYRPR